MSLQRYRKGYRNEQKSIHILESAAYTVFRTAGSRSLFDLIAVNQVGVRFIQVRSNRSISTNEREQIEEWPNPSGSTKEVWIWEDYVKKPKVEIL